MATEVTTKRKQFAEQLLKAETTLIGTSPLTAAAPDLTVEQAYHIQLENITEKVAQGQTVVGKKIGLTSKAMQDLLGVNEPDYGHLLDGMVVENREDIKTMVTNFRTASVDLAEFAKKIEAHPWMLLKKSPEELKAE